MIMDFKTLIFKRNLNQVPSDIIKSVNESRERTEAYLESYAGNRYYIYKCHDKILDEYSYSITVDDINIVCGKNVKHLLENLSDYGYSIANPYGIYYLPVALSQTSYK